MEKMKRIASVILAAVLLLTGIQDVCAAEKEGPGGRAEIDVYARYAEGGSYGETIPVIHGEAQAELSDGSTVNVTGAPNGAAVLRLLKIPVTETEVWEWLRGCVGEGAVIYEAWAIWFEDAEGKYISAGEAEITLISAAIGSTVYSVDTAGYVLRAGIVTENGKAVFTWKGDPYFVTADTENSGPAEKEDGSTAVKTGDNSVCGCAIPLLLLAISSSAAALAGKKRGL